MVRSTGSERRSTVKRRGSKRRAAESEDWNGAHRDRDDSLSDADDPYADPARGDRAAVRAQ
jgi:hypothetical protein